MCMYSNLYTIYNYNVHVAIIMDYDTYSLGYEMSVRGHGGSNFPSITCTLRHIQYNYSKCSVCVVLASCTFM